MSKLGQTPTVVLTLIVFLFLGILTISFAQVPEQKYGILGKMAPKFSAQTWVDGNGAITDPILLSDLKGKVIYLLFFQDW